MFDPWWMKNKIHMILTLGPGIPLEPSRPSSPASPAGPTGPSAPGNPLRKSY